MAYTKRSNGTKTIGSIALAGTLAFGMAHHLRAQDSTVATTAGGVVQVQTAEELIGKHLNI